MGKKTIIAFLIVAATFAVYWQVHNYDFIVLDDSVYVTGNSYVQAGITRDSVSWAFSAIHAQFWHPLTWLSLMLDYELYGLELAGGYHVTNLILHILSALLLFWLFNRMTGSLWRSAFIAAFFALHPLRVESVVWISERKDVLSGFFWMLTLCAYVCYTEKPVIKRYLLVLLCFIFGLMSKPMLVTLPFVMIILDYWPLQRFNLQNAGVTPAQDKQIETNTAERIQKKNRRSANITKLSKFKQLNAVQNWHILEKIPFFIIAVVFSFIAMYTQYASSYKDFPLSSRILNAIISYVIYLEKTFWPHDLAIFYPFPEHFVFWQLMGAVLLLLFISFAAIITAKRFQFLIAGWLWFVITLLPVIGIIQVGLHSFADRYTYLPSIGIGIIIAFGIPNIIPTEKLRKIILSPAAILTLVILAILTWRQCGYWESSIKLFSHTVQVTKNNYLAHTNLGDAFADAGIYNDAADNYKEAIKIDPDYLNAHYNLANVLAEQGKIDEAISHYREVIRIEPNYYPALNNLGQNLIKQGKRTEAVSYLKRALEIEPNDANVHLNLGEALLGLGEPKEAIKHLRTALRLMPDFADAQKLLWRALELENKQKK